MAETTIMSTAQVFTIDEYQLKPWICRDDNGDYWTVTRNISNELEIHKSTTGGTSWVLKKTIQNSDFSGGNPFPTKWFKIMNLSGADKIYVFIIAGTTDSENYGWIFNVTGDTNQIDIDGVDLDASHSSEFHVAWDAYNSRLLAWAQRTSSDTAFAKINLDTTFSTQTFENTWVGVPTDYYIDPVGGYGYTLGKISATGLELKKRKNDADFHTAISGIWSSGAGSDVSWSNVVTDSSGNPVVGYFDTWGGQTALKFTKRDKNNLATTLASGQYTLGAIPSGVVMTMDGNDNIYFIYTNVSDGEAYLVKYNGTSWESPVLLSSDNDGKIVSCERKPALADTNIIYSYQATV